MCGQEGGKDPAVPGAWHALVGAGSEEMSLMPLQAGGGGVGRWGGEAGEGGPGQEVEGLECWSKVLRQEV